MTPANKNQFKGRQLHFKSRHRRTKVYRTFSTRFQCKKKKAEKMYSKMTHKKGK